MGGVLNSHPEGILVSYIEKNDQYVQRCNNYALSSFTHASSVFIFCGLLMTCSQARAYHGTGPVNTSIINNSKVES